MSIRARFLIIIGLLSLVAIVLVGVASYRFSLDNSTAEAKAKGSLVFDFLDASRLHFRDKQKPKIEKLLNNAGEMDDLPAELVSGFALTRGVWEEFSKKNPNYIFKQASVDPLVPANKADAEDMKIITQFQKNPAQKELEGQTAREGKPFYYFAQKIPVTKGCLDCHGLPEKAPKWQKKIYGVEHGYNWKEGDIVSAYIVYIPLQAALAVAQQNSLYLIAIGASLIVVLMLIIWLCFKKYVINPLGILEKRATEISLGKNIEAPIEVKSKDEIGSLGQAVDRLRISVEKMLQRLKK